MIAASPRGKTKGPASRVPPGGGPKLSLTERVYELARRLMREHIIGPEEIAILPYASAGICSIASACDFSEWPKVVLGEFEFPTMGHAWLAQQGRGPQVEFVRAGGEAIPFSSYERSIDRHTRITAVT